MPVSDRLPDRLADRLPTRPSPSLPDPPAVFGADDADDAAFLDRAARWAATLTYSDVPKPVRRAAKAQLTSTVGAAVWTRTQPLGERVFDATTAQYDDGESTFLGGVQLSPAGAAYGNAALSMALDFDDAVLGGHTGHSSVFVPLAYAEATHASGARVLVAHVAANEIAGRLASATFRDPFGGQRAAYIHAVAAAVGRSVIEGDDAETLASALGTALAQPPWPLEASTLGSNAKLWSASEPLECGLAAVESARAGVTGRNDLIERAGGFFDAFATHPLSAFLDEFGERWHTRAVSVKAVPGCTYVTAPIEAALEVRGRFDRGRTEIGRVDVYGPRFTTEANERASPYLDGSNSPTSALSCTVPYNVAVALADGEHTPRQVCGRVADDDVWQLADRVRVHHDPAFTVAALESAVPAGLMLRQVGIPAVGYTARTVGARTALRRLPTVLGFARKRPLPTELASSDERIGARVEVTATDGRTFEATVEHPSGFAGKPLSEIRAVARKKCRTGLEAAGFDESTARRRTDALLAIDDAERVSLAALIEAERTV